MSYSKDEALRLWRQATINVSQKLLGYKVPQQFFGEEESLAFVEFMRLCREPSRLEDLIITRACLSCKNCGIQNEYEHITQIFSTPD